MPHILWCLIWIYTVGGALCVNLIMIQITLTVLSVITGFWVVQQGASRRTTTREVKVYGFLFYMSSMVKINIKCGASSEFVSLSIPSWQILTTHVQPFRGARDLAFYLKVPLDSLLVWVSSGGSGETVWMRRLAWTFAARTGDKYQIRLMRSINEKLNC